MIDGERDTKKRSGAYHAGEAIRGLFRARRTPVCIVVLGSPDDVWPTAFQGFRREARLTPGYARTAFQAEYPLTSYLSLL